MAADITTACADEVLRITGAAVAIADEAALEGTDDRAEQLPREVLLVPWGPVRSTNGDFVVDEESAAAVVAAFQSHGTDLVIDYEHQSLGGRYSAPSGLAPAAGWVTGLRAAAGEGIWGTVRWTPGAVQRILRREYRFVSPVVIVRKGDRKVVALDSVALTNRPAISGMRPVVNRADPAEPDRTEVSREEGQMQEEMTQLRKLLALEEAASAQDVVRQACARLTDLLGEAQRREATQKVAHAMQAGKLAESQREWAIGYALRDPMGFEQWLADAPVVVPMQQVVGTGADSAAADATQRRAVIAAARGQWEANRLLQQLTGQRAYVNQALVEAGFEPVAGEEA